MKYIVLVPIFFGLTGTTFAANGVIEVVPGKAGDLQISRLYSVDYQCSVPGSVGGLIGNIKGPAGIVSSGTLVENVSIVSMSAAAAPTNPAPVPVTPGASPPSAGAGVAPAPNIIFGTNVLGYSYVSITNTPINNKCGGQFFISGAENYRIDAQVGISSTNTFADTISKVATLVKSAATSMYALFRVTKPVEFDSTVEQGKEILSNYQSFAEIFSVNSQAQQNDSGNLRVGKNWVITYDDQSRPVSTLLLEVRPIVSLVMDGHTKFLAAYNAAATSSGITLTGSDQQAMRDQCDHEAQKYITAGIRDNRDIAFLLYRRLLVSFTAHQNIAYCMGREVANAALSILKTKPDIIPVLDAYRLVDIDIKNILVVSESTQPHNRPSLANDVSDFVDLLDRHLQSGGLRGDQRVALLKYFAPSLDVEDMTRGYRALGLIFPEVTEQDNKSVDGPGLLDALRKSGISRWLCVQRTKQAVIASALPIYDAKIDSAVMVVAAKAGADDKLDRNKTPLFGVHLKFNKSSNNEPLVINQMIFEERYRDIIIKDNNCIPDSPKEPTVPTKPSS
jgi:hypothetical protein